MPRLRSILFLPVVLTTMLLIGGSRFSTPSTLAAPRNTITVTSTADSGQSTLRDALTNSTAGDVIDFNLSNCPCTISLLEELFVEHDLTIQGPGAPQLIISGPQVGSVFGVNNGAVTISGLTITGGNGDNGGGIYNNATLTLADMAISNNNALSGGGIYNDNGAILVGDRLLINGNRANGNFGGGILNSGDGRVTLTNTTISENYAADDAGGIYNNDSNNAEPLNDVTLLNVTITNNSSATDAGGIDNYGTINFQNMLIAGNHAPGDGPDCRNPYGHPYNSFGNNLIGSNQNCAFNAQQSDLVGTSSAPIDPRLNALADNGGPTQTHSLMANSPALDAANSGTCPATDQRGVTRPQGAACDIGAFEAQQLARYNSAWFFAQRVDPNPTAVVTEYLTQPDQSRWYKFAVSPRSKVTVTLTNLPADYNLTVYKDILVAYNQDRDALNNASPTNELVKLGAQFSPEAFSPEAFSPEAFSPEAFSPEAFSPEAFSSAQMHSIVGVSAFPGTASEGISINTWDNAGDYYVRVRGANGAYDANNPFTLTITIESSDCTGVHEITTPTSLTASSTNQAALILVDWSRMPGSTADKNTLATKLNSLASATNGVVVDVSQDARVSDANAQADAHAACPVAKNLVASAIKDVIDLYDVNQSLQYIVLIGDDAVIPFFRYPDQAMLAAESGYIPPVRDSSASQSSLRLNYVLTQDPYASRVDISRGDNTFVIPAIAIGRLVETPNEIGGMIDAYLNLNNGVTPLTTNALVTGYDFMADAATQIKSELEAGMGNPADALIAPRDAAPTDPASWNADALKTAMLNQRHDILFLGGHFSQGSALAADWTTHLPAYEIAASSVNLQNAIVFSAGCHSGYNLVDADSVNGITLEPDWAQAFARKQVTFIGGTGYQYGDTDVIEYTERLLVEFAQELRTGSGPVSVGQALLRAKQEYLANTPQLRGIHEKTLLESTLFGLPMLQVDMPGQRLASSRHNKPESNITPIPYGNSPGATLNLQYADLNVNTSLSEKHLTYKQFTNNTNVDATYFQGPNGIVSNPTEPILPLQNQDVSANGTVLRGVGFRGGTYSDLQNILPATSAPATEIRGVHAPFPTQVFFPVRVWSINYFDTLAQNGATRLMLTPAQYRANATDPAHGAWRHYSDLSFRLFYSNNTTNYNTANVDSIPALSAAPALSNINATVNGSQITFNAKVVGNPAAGIQEVWVTYTGTSGDLFGAWQSLNLMQNASDTTLWQGTLTLNTTAAENVRYIIQAVNGVGLVTLAANLGNYYTPITDSTTAPADTALEFNSPPTSGKYADSATFTARLTSNGNPVANKFITFGLGAQRRGAVTNANGQATVNLSLLTLPSTYNVGVSFAGDTDSKATSATTSFQVIKQNTHLALVTPSQTAQYSDVADLFASVRDDNDRALGQVSVAFVAKNANDTQAATAVTNFASEAHVTNIPFKAGTYDLTASFGDSVTINGATIDLSDPRYNPSNANGSIHIIAESATVTYTGETSITASAGLSLGATVTQEDDGHPGDIRLAQVHYQLFDKNSQPVAEKTDSANLLGKSSAAMTNLPDGVYTLKVTVVGGFYNSDPIEIPIISSNVALAQNVKLRATDNKSFDALEAKFKLDGRQTQFKLTDTVPSTFNYIATLNNTGNLALNTKFDLTLPSSDNPALSPAFCLVGANAVQVFDDAEMTKPVTKNITVTPAMPDGADSAPRMCSSHVTVKLNIPANAKRIIRLELEFAGKGATGFEKNAAKRYAQGFVFTGVVTNDKLPAPLQDVTGLALVGARLTGVGGFTFDNRTPRNGYTVRVMKAGKQIGQTKTDANGFFVVRVPSGGPYQVQLLDPTTNDVIAGANVASVTAKQFVKVNLK